MRAKLYDLAALACPCRLDKRASGAAIVRYAHPPAILDHGRASKKGLTTRQHHMIISGSDIQTTQRAYLLDGRCASTFAIFLNLDELVYVSLQVQPSVVTSHLLLEQSVVIRAKCNEA